MTTYLEEVRSIWIIEVILSPSPFYCSIQRNVHTTIPVVFSFKKNVSLPLHSGCVQGAVFVNKLDLSQFGQLLEFAKTTEISTVHVKLLSYNLQHAHERIILWLHCGSHCEIYFNVRQILPQPAKDLQK